MSKIDLTRRVQREYRDILAGSTSVWCYPYKYPSRAQEWADLYGWAALHFARRWRSRDIDLKALERVVLRSKNARCAYEWARDIPGARLRRLEKVILESQDIKSIRAFSRLPGVNRKALENLIVIAEVLLA